MDLIGFENYLIYPDGKIYNKIRKTFMKPRIEKSGYERIGLTKNGKQEQFYIHRLVAQHYIPNPENLPIADHIDFNRTNNDVSNLRWFSIRSSLIHRTTCSTTPNIVITKSNTYSVRFQKVNKLMYGKTFKTLEEAEQARDAYILENNI